MVRGPREEPDSPTVADHPAGQAVLPGDRPMTGRSEAPGEPGPIRSPGLYLEVLDVVMRLESLELFLEPLPLVGTPPLDRRARAKFPAPTRFM